LRQAESSRIQSFFLYGAIALLPYVVFYWFLPFYGHLTIGNDYPLFSIQNQLALQYSLYHGSFPLYAPGFAMGRSAAALTLGQLYHPISHLSAMMPGYWRGNALDWNTFGICQLALLIFLRRLTIGLLPAFILSFLAVYNLRMLDMFRYGASLESYTGFVLLCVALGSYYLHPTKLWGALAIIGSTYLMVCGGHPQMMYLGLLGALIWAAFVPRVVAALQVDNYQFQLTAGKYYWRVLGCVVVGLLLSCAYLLPFYFDFASDSATRGVREYEWSLAYSDTVLGAIRSIFDPLMSDVHGNFASSSLILLVLLLPILFFVGRRAPLAIVALWFVCLCLFFLSVGDATPLYFLYWKLIPFADHFRTPGRIAVMLPLMMTPLLAWLIKRQESYQSSDGNHRSWYTNPLVLLSAIGLALFAGYQFSPLSNLPSDTLFVPERINAIPAWVTRTVTYLGGASLAVLLTVGWLGSSAKWRRWEVPLGIVLVGAVMTQVTLELRFGTWVSEKRSTTQLTAMDARMKNGLEYMGSPGYGMESAAVSEQMRQSILERSMAKYYRCWRFAPTHDEAYGLLAKRTRADVAIIEGQGDESGDLAMSDQCERVGRNKPQEVDIVSLNYSSFNRVQFDVAAGRPGFLTYGEPVQSGWRAYVDGVEGQLYRANGYLPAVYVPSGRHSVEYRYTSLASRIGMAISLCVLSILGVYVTLAVTTRIAARFAGIAVSILLPTICFGIWSRSLYAGDNLGTHYNWSSRQFSVIDNIAYGKRTRMSSQSPRRQSYETYSGNGVDGSFRTAFITDVGSDSQWWEVDLGSVYFVDSLNIYRYLARKVLPLRVFCSVDGKKYSRVTDYRHKLRELNFRIPLGGTRARYIKLVSLDKESPLAFMEIRAFGKAADETAN